MKVLIIDNNDSFTYNLVQMLRESNAEPVIKSIDDIYIDEVLNYKKILISPGPGMPSEKLLKIIRKVDRDSSLLGVCLGQQAIAEAFGAKLKPSMRICHGEATEIIQIVNDYKLFSGLPEKFSAGRYHSWIIDPLTLTFELETTAEDVNGEIMGIRHKTLDIHAVQFHPESILTPQGNLIIFNWLKVSNW